VALHRERDVFPRKLSGQGISTTLALIIGGLIPGVRSVLSLIRTRKADYLAVMMVALFAVSLLDSW
jgi:hypothetical protein